MLGFGVTLYTRPVFTLINSSNKTGQAKLVNFALCALDPLVIVLSIRPVAKTGYETGE